MSTAGPVRRTSIPRAALVLLATAAGVVVIAGLHQIAWLAGPLFLGLVLVILAHPVHGWLRRHRVPAWLASGILLLVIYAADITIFAILVLSIGRLVTILPSYTSEAEELIGGLTQFLREQGIGSEGVRAIAAGLDLGKLARLLLQVLLGLVNLGSSLVLLLSLMLFLGIESTGAGSRLAALATDRPGLAAALTGFATRTRRFLGVTTIFGLITGLADTLLLLALDIPLAILWGLLAFVCNYIPYVGFIIGLVPPALLALLGGDWRLMIIVIISYIVLNSLFTSLIQPYFVGDAVGVSMTVTLVALVFWGWVLGPLGAILAIPLTLLVKALLIDSDPRAGWAEAVIGPSRKHHPQQATAADPTTSHDGSEEDES